MRPRFQQNPGKRDNTINADGDTKLEDQPEGSPPILVFLQSEESELLSVPHHCILVYRFEAEIPESATIRLELWPTHVHLKKATFDWFPTFAVQHASLTVGHWCKPDETIGPGRSTISLGSGP